MPANKSALLRYRIIDACLTNSMHMYPTMEYIIDKIEQQLDTSLSSSMFTKDIANMRSIYSAPIKYERGKRGYHYTEEGFSISSFPLSHEEILALDFSTALLQQLKHTQLFHHFETAINKVIQGYRISKILGKSEQQLLQVEVPVKEEGSQWIEGLLEGIIEKKTLQVLYHPYGRPEKSHLFSPYLLKEYRNRWYAAGYSTSAKNILVIALDRITTLTNSKEKYVVDNGFSPDDFFKYSYGITQIHGAKSEKVILFFNKTQAPYIISQPLHHSQIVVAENDKGLKVELEVYLTQELLMSILSFGANVEVLAPQKLIGLMKKSTEEMAETYAKSK